MKNKKTDKKIWLLACMLSLSFAFYTFGLKNSSAQNIFADSDQDGLTDEEEKTYGTDPQNRDTDRDSYSDGAEVKSGYDPKIPAPGDRLVDLEQISPSKTADLKNDNGNLTEKISQKIADLPTDSEISIDNIQSIIDESLSAQNIENEIPQISESDIEIKKQNYGKYSDKKAAELKKEDFSEYIAAVFYIFSSNSPFPITSGSDIGSSVIKMFNKINLAVSTRNPESLTDISQSGSKMLEQLYAVEVPEDLVDFHIKALRYALYAQNLKNILKSDPKDPMSDIANLSKIEAFIQNVMDFSSDLENVLDKYEVNYSDIQDKIKDYGIDLPDFEDLNLNIDSSEN